MILTGVFRIVSLFTEVDNSIPLRVIHILVNKKKRREHHIFSTFFLLKTMVANSLATTSQFSS
jgi:hypothetical protein